MTVTQLVIDAETAAEYLSHNRSNRPVSESHVRRLANDMVEGRWRLPFLKSELPMPVVL